MSGNLRRGSRVVQLISDSVSWLNNLLHSLLSCKYTYTFISCPVGILVCHETTEYQGHTALAALSSRRPNNYTSGEIPCPYSNYLGAQDPDSCHTPHQLIPGRLPNLPNHNPSPLQHPTPRDPKHHTTRSTNLPLLYLSAHLRHPESTIATAPLILTHCDKSQSFSGPKLPLRTRSQDARFPGGVLGLVRCCAVCCLQQVVRIDLPGAGAVYESQ